MAVQLLYGQNFAFADGVFAPGALASFFLSGTTTPQTVYADEALTIPHPTPLVADASGRFPVVWGADGVNFKAVVTDASGASVFTQDKCVLGNVQLGSAEDISLAPVAGLTATDVQEAIEELIDAPDFQGNPTAPTQTVGNNSTRLANTAFVAGEIGALSNDGAVQATTSGASITQAIPADVQEVKIIFDGVSFSNLDSLRVRLGASSTPQASGYNGTSGYARSGTTVVSNETDEFMLQVWGGTDAVTGAMTLTRFAAGSDRWIAGFVGASEDELLFSSGAVTLSGELDVIELSADTSATFDAGEISVRWRF